MLFRVLVVLVFLSTPLVAAAQEVYPFKRLVVGASEKSVAAVNIIGDSAKIVYDADIPLFGGDDFRGKIAPYVGRPITTELVNELSGTISAFSKAHDRLITQVLVPHQFAGDGTLRFVVVFGRFKDLTVRGNRWFSSKLLEQQLGIKPGDEIRLSVLERAVDWANTNPFRQVKVLVNDLPAHPGTADLLIGVEEQRPWRYSVSADDYGTSLLGNRHYTGTVQFGNLWGLDHQGAYQYMTTDDIHLFQAHLLTYRIPTPSRHFFDFNASYSEVHGVFGNTDQFNQTGRNESAEVKYSIPLRNGENPIEVHASFDFKRGNNNLEYAGERVYAAEVDTLQFGAGGSSVHHDRNGGWLVGMNVNLSPGGLDSRNHTSVYRTARNGADPTYVYGNLSLQRLQELGHGWELSARLLGQVSSTNLLGSEQLTAGGATSVRGYNTNLYAGDEGAVLNLDVLTPIKNLSLQSVLKHGRSLQSRLVIFYDAANVFLKHPQNSDVPTAPMTSAGAGLRMSIANNFTLNFDYGWQITHIPAIYHQTEHGRGHIKVVLAF
jgi:hemolysin activation/secretion protein